MLLNASTQLDERRGLLITNKTSYLIKDFDLAYFRTWGQEAARNLAHAWQLILEQHGVPCVDPLRAKLYNHNKHTMMRLFQENKVPMPHTVVVDKGTSIDTCIQTIKEHFTDRVVIKGEGCGGKNLQFIKVEDETQLRQVLLENYTLNERVGPKPLVLQQYIPSKNQAGYMYHYRILVVGGEIVAAKRFTASKRDILAFNRYLGATKEIVAVDDILSAEQQEAIKSACELTGTNVAGVDATVVQGKLYIFEVNNCPGLTFPESQVRSERSVEASIAAYMEKIVAYTIHHLARKR